MEIDVIDMVMGVNVFFGSIDRSDMEIFILRFLFCLVKVMGKFFFYC